MFEESVTGKQRFIKINEISPTMCTAKWLQTTLHLQVGMTHSCHHPPKHKIPLDTLHNPSALHNTQEKLNQRAALLRGEQPDPCNYCWNIENMGPDFVSDRYYKSVSDWSWPNLDRVKISGLGENITPSYLEVSFENTCNFKCLYCLPDISSRWFDEAKQYGRIELPSGQVMHDLDHLARIDSIPYKINEDNPYINAFWNWWPEMYKTLDTIRITGGEPLLSKHTWRLLDYVLENPRADLTVSINSNLNVPDKLLLKLEDICTKLSGVVKEVLVYTSADGAGAENDYVRTGMNYDTWLNNVHRFLDNTPDNVVLSHMITANALSSYSFLKYLEDLYVMKRKYNFPDDNKRDRVMMMISYLRWPNFFTVQELPEQHKRDLATTWYDFMFYRARVGNPTMMGGRFYSHELDQINRLIEWMNSANNFETKKADLIHFLKEMDFRRGTDHKAIFPDLCAHLYK